MEPGEAAMQVAHAGTQCSRLARHSTPHCSVTLLTSTRLAVAARPMPLVTTSLVSWPPKSSTRAAAGRHRRHTQGIAAGASCSPLQPEMGKAGTVLVLFCLPGNHVAASSSPVTCEPNVFTKSTVMSLPNCRAGRNRLADERAHPLPSTKRCINCPPPAQSSAASAAQLQAGGDALQLTSSTISPTNPGPNSRTRSPTSAGSMHWTISLTVSGPRPCSRGGMAVSCGRHAGQPGASAAHLCGPLLAGVQHVSRPACGCCGKARRGCPAACTHIHNLCHHVCSHALHCIRRDARPHLQCIRRVHGGLRWGDQGTVQ